MYDIKILNATYYDYDKKEYFTHDIGIKNGKIESIGKSQIGAKHEIDAKGYITSPGFIDIHMHEERLGKYDFEQEFYIGERMLNMGVTTAIGGNCGLSLHDPVDFMDKVKSHGAPVNYGLQIGYNTLRESYGLGNFDKTPDSVQEQILEDVKKLINLGVKGISFGIEYSPAIHFEEMVKVTGLLDPNKHMVSAHYRADTVDSKASVEEIINISRITGIPAQVSHIGSCSGYGQMEDSLESIEKARQEGLNITADCYPYHAFCTFIGSEVFAEGCIEKWQSGYEDILLTEPPYKNVHCDQAIFNKVRKDYPQMLAVAFVMKEEEIATALKAPFVMVASDELYNGDKGHPRGAGTFPRVLGKYVREENILDLEDALYKMTKFPAEKLQLKTKGQIKLGYDADITIFDPDEIIDQADFIKDPTAPPIGIEHVIVNGVLGICDGKRTKSNAGQYI